ncbi:hypothetical protein EVAR_29326_1 [Eumeta japonica]|uniref:Uncharacterized protein n=1 Tax=Eumeta variegata TaxID=151549 RepID=A0A4C1WK90_EUMVA|nr:hypothetical protein EVAR_29326_1 [Eumeta japonica]
MVNERHYLFIVGQRQKRIPQERGELTAAAVALDSLVRGTLSVLKLNEKRTECGYDRTGSTKDTANRVSPAGL